MAQPVTRTELTLGQIARSWSIKPQGELFTKALLDFLRALPTRDTLRSYSFSILQFFDWYANNTRELPTPREVSRADAARFQKYLRERDVNLTRWRLEQDPERKLDLSIYDIVAASPNSDIDHIRNELLRTPSFTTYVRGRLTLKIDTESYAPMRSGLGVRLACLARVKTLHREPSLEEYRRQQRSLEQPPENAFSYSIPRISAEPGPERASTIATRLSALAGLWDYMIRSGENAPGMQKPLLQHNIWSDPLKLVQKQAPSHRQASRARKTPGLDLFFRLLSTTFTRTHKQNALDAARRAFWNEQVPSTITVKPTFKDLRDRALLLLMAQTGLRSREIHKLRRKSLTGDPPTLTVTGKRDTKRTIGVPAAPLQALLDMNNKLHEMAAHQRKYRGTSRAEILLSSDAPLLPAVAYWGANSGIPERGLSRPAIGQMMRRRAIASGIDPSSPDYAKAHPHGLRHMFIKLALESTPPHQVMAIVGHTSMATTSKYAEEREPEKLIAKSLKGEPIKPPAPKREKPPKLPPEPKIVECVQPEIEPQPALAEAPAAPPPTADELSTFAQKLERYRDKPLTEDEEERLLRCKQIGSETMQKLCAIYTIHWGEKGNRQQVEKSGGGIGRRQATETLKLVKRLLAEGKTEQAEEIAKRYIHKHRSTKTADHLKLLISGTTPFTSNPEDESLFEEEEEGEEKSLEEQMAEASAAVSSIVEAAERTEAAAVQHEAGSERATRIYGGKDSGLCWWTGTKGRLIPEMPIPSPDQVTGDQLREDVADLWTKFITKQPTRAGAIERWTYELLDTAGQLEDVVLTANGTWMRSAVDWSETKLKGTRRSPEARTVFREHIEREIVAWMRAISVSYQVSTGSPEDWKKHVWKPKVKGQRPPTWYEKEDPIKDLPLKEREELLDWIGALSGYLPTSTDRVFQSVSRADVSLVVNSLCAFDAVVDRMREDPDVGPFKTAGLMKKVPLDKFPDKFRRALTKAADDADRNMRMATRGRIASIDIKKLVGERLSRRKATGSIERRSTWYLKLVRSWFGEQAATDSAIRLVTLCGKVPLRSYAELFRIEGDTIKHPKEFKKAFTLRYGTHSECVARRIARQLWETKKANPKSQYITRPEHMQALVQVMQSFRVPCSERQEDELVRLLPPHMEPQAIRATWASFLTSTEERPEMAEEALTSGTRAIQYEEVITAEDINAFVKGIYGGSFKPNEPTRLPTPVHLAWCFTSPRG